jgi:predicted FMN-binding regulatory protein PaiB
MRDPILSEESRATPSREPSTKEGKWKVSQNRTPAEKQGVVAGLTSLDTPASLTMKNLVAERS